MSKVMAFLEIEALPSAGCVAKEWAAASRMPPAVANWRLSAISDFALEAGGSEHNFSVRPFGVSCTEDWEPPEGVTIDPWDDDPWALQRQQLLAPFITNSPPRLDLDWRRIYFDLRGRRAADMRQRASIFGGYDGPPPGTVKTRLSPHFGGFTGFESDSEDTRRGHELRCTYGLAAVREEDKRHKASCVRRSWALIDPTGEARATAAARWGPLD